MSGDLMSRMWQPFGKESINGDNEQHLLWIFNLAKERAAAFHIEGVTMKLTKGSAHSKCFSPFLCSEYLSRSCQTYHSLCRLNQCNCIRCVCDRGFQNRHGMQVIFLRSCLLSRSFLWVHSTVLDDYMMYIGGQAAYTYTYSIERKVFYKNPEAKSHLTLLCRSHVLYVATAILKLLFQSTKPFKTWSLISNSILIINSKNQGKREDAKREREMMTQKE